MYSYKVSCFGAGFVGIPTSTVLALYNSDKQVVRSYPVRCLRHQPAPHWDVQTKQTAHLWARTWGSHEKNQWHQPLLHHQHPLSSRTHFRYLFGPTHTYQNFWFQQGQGLRPLIHWNRHQRHHQVLQLAPNERTCDHSLEINRPNWHCLNDLQVNIIDVKKRKYTQLHHRQQPWVLGRRHSCKRPHESWQSRLGAQTNWEHWQLG